MTAFYIMKEFKEETMAEGADVAALGEDAGFEEFPIGDDYKFLLLKN